MRIPKDNLLSGAGGNDHRRRFRRLIIFSAFAISRPSELWHGLLTRPQGVTEGLPKLLETFGRPRWHGQETMPQPGLRFFDHHSNRLPPEQFADDALQSQSQLGALAQDD